MMTKVRNSAFRYRPWKYAFLLLSALSFGLQGFSQSVSAILKADSNKILIGDQLNVRLTIKHSKELQLAIPTLQDTLGNMEIIRSSKMDTSSEGNTILLTQVYTVSAYDSGEFHAGPVLLFFKNSTGTVDSLLSNSVPILVNTLDVDTAKPFKPIKAPLEVPYSWKEFLYYLIPLLLLLLLIIGGYLLWKKRKNKTPDVYVRPKPKDPAHVWARKELKKLQEEKLWQKDEMKLYYTRLTDVLRLYLEYRYSWMALESTTEEIAAEISNYPMNDVAKKLLLETLRNADLVKFAKMQPLPDANMKSMEQALNFIEVTAPTETKTEEKS